MCEIYLYLQMLVIGWLFGTPAMVTGHSYWQIHMEASLKYAGVPV